MRSTAAILLTISAFFVSPPVFAQAGQLRALALRHQEDIERLRDYEWKSKTLVTVDGETLELELVGVHLDAQGGAVRTPIRDGTRRNRKAAKFAEDVRQLLQSYTRFTPKEMYTVFDGANVFPERVGDESLLRFQARGVVRPGDRMYMWADSLDHRLRRVEIETSLDGLPVHVVTTYRDLEDGPTCVERTTVRTELKKKPTVIDIEDFDHVRRDD